MARAKNSKKDLYSDLEFVTPSEKNIDEENKETESKNATNKEAMPFVPEGKRITDEVRSRHVQLLMKPSLYAKAKAEAEEKGLSFNAYIEKLIDDHFKYINI